LLRKHRVLSISGGLHHSACVSVYDTGAIRAELVSVWGSNAQGQLGHIPNALIQANFTDNSVGEGSAANSSPASTNGSYRGRVLKPWSIEKLKRTTTPPSQNAFGSSIVQIGCGSLSTYAVTENGEMWCTGNNKFGQCGVISGNMSPSPSSRELESSVSIVPDWRRVDVFTSMGKRVVRTSPSFCGAHCAVLTERAWVEDTEVKECMGCRVAFTFTTRRHHW